MSASKSRWYWPALKALAAVLLFYLAARFFMNLVSKEARRSKKNAAEGDELFVGA